MGGAGSKCCGASSTPAKDKDDKYMDDVEYEKLGVEGVDSVLEPAFDILQTVVSVNNTLWQTVDTVKLVGSVLMGSLEAELVIQESAVKVIIQKEDDTTGEKIPVAEILGGTGAETTKLLKEDDYKKVTDTPDALTAVQGAAEALGQLNNTLKEASMVGVSAGAGNRLKPVVGDVGEDAGQKKQVTDAKNAIVGFNNTYFKVKLQLMKMELSSGLSGAISELIANIKKLVQDIKPSLEINFEKLMDGELDIKPDLGISVQKIANTCPKKVKKCLDALFGEKFLTTGDPLSPGGLLATLKETAAQCAEILTKFQEISQGVQELGSDPAKLVEQAGEAGLSGIEKLAFPKKVAANIKTAMKTPLILAGLVTTIKDITMEIKEGLTASADNMMDAKI